MYVYCPSCRSDGEVLLQGSPKRSLKAVCWTCHRVWLVLPGHIRSFQEVRRYNDDHREASLAFESIDGQRYERTWLRSIFTHDLGALDVDWDHEHFAFALVAVNASGPSDTLSAIAFHEDIFVFDSVPTPIWQGHSFWWFCSAFFASGLLTVESAEPGREWMHQAAWILLALPIVEHLFRLFFRRRPRLNWPEPQAEARPTAIQDIDKQLRDVDAHLETAKEESRRWQARIREMKRLEARMSRRTGYQKQLELLAGKRQQVEEALEIERNLTKAYVEQREGLLIERDKIIMAGLGDDSLNERVAHRFAEMMRVSEALREQLFLIEAESELSEQLGEF